MDEGIRAIHFSAPLNQAVENMREDLKEALRSVALHLQLAHNEQVFHEDAVEKSIIKLIQLCDKMNSENAPAYSEYNMLGGSIGMDFLKALCTTNRSDELFKKLFFGLKGALGSNLDGLILTRSMDVLTAESRLIYTELKICKNF